MDCVLVLFLSVPNFQQQVKISICHCEGGVEDIKRPPHRTGDHNTHLSHQNLPTDTFYDNFNDNPPVLLTLIDIKLSP